MKNKIFIGVCGGSASGKTTLCAYLQEYFKNSAQVISQDNYYHDKSGLTESELKKINFDNPDSVDLDRLYEDLVRLRDYSDAVIPQYCFKTHSRHENEKIIQVKKINIVEGLFIFENDNLRNLFDYKIFVSADDDIRLARRIRRDHMERGRSVDSILDQYISHVKPMHKKHVESKMKYADCVINTSGSIPMETILEGILPGICM